MPDHKFKKKSQGEEITMEKTEVLQCRYILNSQEVFSVKHGWDEEFLHISVFSLACECQGQFAFLYGTELSSEVAEPYDKTMTHSLTQMSSERITEED